MTIINTQNDSEALTGVSKELIQRGDSNQKYLGVCVCVCVCVSLCIYAGMLRGGVVLLTVSFKGCVSMHSL